jgi:hypothetical protein
MLPSGICRLNMTCCSPHLLTSWILILLLTIFVLQVTKSLQDFSAIKWDNGENNVGCITKPCTKCIQQFIYASMIIDQSLLKGK